MKADKMPRTLVEVLDLREKIAAQVSASQAELVALLEDITDGKGRVWGPEYKLICRVSHPTVPGGIRMHTFRHADLEGKPTTSWSSDWYTGKDDSRLRRAFQVDPSNPLAELTWDATWEEQVGLDKAEKAIRFSRLEHRTSDLRRRLHTTEQVIARTFFGAMGYGRNRWFNVREVTVGRHKFWVLTDGTLTFTDAVVRMEVNPQTEAVSVVDFRDRMDRKKRMNRKEAS